MSCLVKIRAVRDELSANEKKIANFILANSGLIRDYSSQQLAGSVGVSQSSIVKFSQKLGYKGFTDLKLAIHEAVVKSESAEGDQDFRGVAGTGDDSARDRLIQLKQEALVSTLGLNDENTLLEAVRAIENAHRIRVVALGAGSLVARNFANLLVRLGKPVMADMDAYSQLAGVTQLDRGDVVMIISFSGQSSRMVHIARQAKKAGATLISLTSYSANPVKSLADVQLFSVVGQEGGSDLPEIVAHTSQQHVADMLAEMLVRRDRRARERLLSGRRKLDSLV